MMPSLSFAARSTDEVADAYVRSRGKSRFLSTARAVRAMRLCLPNCDVTDRKLEEIVASAAIKHGISVKFDVMSAVVSAPQGLSHAPIKMDGLPTSDAQLPEIDAFGKLMIDYNSRDPLEAWTVLKFGRIDHSMIFRDEQTAAKHACLQPGGSRDDVASVIVTGREIRRA